MDPVTSSALSAMTVLICDALANLDVEIRHVWRRRHTWVKWSYIYLRYFPILLLGSTLMVTTSEVTRLTYGIVTCQALYGFTTFGTNSSVWIVDSLLIARVSALYGLSRRIKVILRSVLLTEFIIMVVSCAFSIPKASFTQGCFATNMPRICLASWLASIITQTILFALTMIHFRRSYQQQIQGSIERTLTRDGLWVFGAVSLVNVGYILMLHFTGFSLQGYGNVIYFWILVAFSVTGCGVQLNLYEGVDLVGEGAPSSFEDMTSINFAHTPEMQRI